MGAQIIADLFESDGWEVRFVGSGLTNDDIFAYINNYAPDILLIHGTTPKQAPGIRQFIDKIRDVNAWPEMRIVVSGGLFARAEGLWEEIGADAYASNAHDALQIASADTPLPRCDRRTINRRKRNKQIQEQAQEQYESESATII